MHTAFNQHAVMLDLSVRMDTQQQVTAARRLLRAGGRRRQGGAYSGDHFCAVNISKEHMEDSRLEVRLSGFRLALVSLALAGCAQIPQYQDATGNETAKLRLRMEAPIISNLFLVSVDIESCKPQAGFSWVSGGVDSLYVKRVGMLDSKPPAEGTLEYVIPANKPLAARTVMHLAKLNAAEILFALSPVTQGEIAKKQPGTCPAPGFLPKAGEQYEIVFSAQPGTCKTTVYRLEQTPSETARIDITRTLNIQVVDKGQGRLSCQAL